MIKIFSFIASCAGEKSRTLTYSNALAAAFTRQAEAIGEQVSYESLTGDKLKINFCRSCNNCFKKGVCSLAGTDDVERLKEKFLAADIIFFGTPVYLTDISGVARCIFDRITYWSHRFELAGKVVAVFSTSSGNHMQEVADRLKEFFEYMGAVVATSSYGVTKEGYPNLYLEHELTPAVNEVSKKILNVWQNPAPNITEKMEQYFAIRNHMTKRALLYEELTGIKPWDEFTVCHSRGMENFPTYAEYFSSRGEPL